MASLEDQEVTINNAIQALDQLFVTKPVDLGKIRMSILKFNNLIDIYTLESRYKPISNPNSDNPPKNQDSRKFIRFCKGKYKEFNDRFNKCKMFDDIQIDILEEETEQKEQEKIKKETELMEHGLKVSNQSTEHLKNILRVTNDAKEIGTTTCQTLDNQGNQIAHISQNLEQIDTTMSRSKKVISRIGRKLLTDKCLWIVGLLLIAASIFIIVYKYKTDKL